jgi:hypothetical protein
MENSIDVGLGTGLSAQLNDAAGMARMGMQADISRQKIGADKAQKEGEEYRKIMEDLTENGKFKQHRLVVGDAMKLSAEATEKAMQARNSGDPNWRNQLWTIRQDYNTKMAELTAKSMRFAEIDKMLTPGAERTMYVAPEVKAFQNIYNTATSYKDLVEKTRENGIESPYVAVADTGDVHLYMPPKIALQPEITLTGKNLGVYSQMYKVKNEKGGFITEEVLAPFVTIADAENYAKAKGLNDVPTSVEFAAIQKLETPGFKEQYADAKGVSVRDDAKLKEELMKDIVLSTRSQTANRFFLQRVTNVNVNTGLEVGSQLNSLTEGNAYNVKSYPGSVIETQGEYGLAVNADAAQLGRNTMNANTWQAGQPITDITEPLITKLVVLPSDTNDLPLRKNEAGKLVSNTDPNKTYDLKPVYRLFFYITDKTGLSGYYIAKKRYMPGIGDVKGSKDKTAAINNAIETLQKKADELNKGK